MSYYQNKLTKTLDDLESYVRGFKRLSKNLNEPQAAELEAVVSSVLTLLVALRRDSHLGETSIRVTHL